jgi:hypothetical protein
VNFEKNKKLKEAVFGYVSKVQFLIRRSSTLGKIKTYMEISLNKLMRRYNTLLTEAAQDQSAVFSYLCRINDKGNTNNFCYSVIAIENKIRKVFEEFDVNIDFLFDNNIAWLDFANFVIDLADILENRKQDGEISPENETEVIREEMHGLVVRRYTMIRVEIVEIMVIRLNTVTLISGIAIQLRSVLQIHTEINDVKCRSTLHQEGQVSTLVVEDDDHSPKSSVQDRLPH